MAEDFQNSLKISHILIKNHISVGDIVIDATMGKGRDTLLLSYLVGSSGKVYSFDIQNSAILYTKSLLQDNKAEDNVILINDSHENMDTYVKEEVNGIMFNLGYMPGGDHRITTCSNSTLKALQRGMNLLKRKGIITICIYDGHPQGKEEEIHIKEFLQNVDNKSFAISFLTFINQPNNPPKLIIIQKN